jgi:hypothetical protein
VLRLILLIRDFSQLNWQLQRVHSPNLRRFILFVSFELLPFDEPDSFKESSMVDICHELKARHFPNLTTLAFNNRLGLWKYKAIIKQKLLIDGGGIDVKVKDIHWD